MHELRSTLTTLRGRPSPRLWRIAGYALEFGLLGVALALTRILTIYLWRLPNGDVVLYHRYALAFWTTPPLFHALPVEYPPLAILPFSLTLLPPIPDYLALYAYWMGALALVGYAAFLRFTSHRRALVYALYLLVGATATILARFDLVPALLTLAALWATQRRRFSIAYVLIAAGVLLKLYPIFLLPVVLIAHTHDASAQAQRNGRVSPSASAADAPWWAGGPRALVTTTVKRLRGVLARPALVAVARGAALCLGVVGLVFAGAFALNPGGALSGFSYASDRPLQVESTPATLLWLGTLVGIPAHPVYTFSSLNLVGPLDVALKPLSAVALLLTCALVYWRQARGRLPVDRAFVACLCAVIVTNKLFSPQYLIWVLPAAAAVEGFDLLWLAVCVLTTIDFPILYLARHTIETVTYTPAFMPVLAARNLLLIAITVRAVLRPPRSATRNAPPTSPLRGGDEPARATAAGKPTGRTTGHGPSLPETALRRGNPHVTLSGDRHIVTATERQGRATARGPQFRSRGSR